MQATIGSGSQSLPPWACTYRTQGNKYQGFKTHQSEMVGTAGINIRKYSGIDLCPTTASTSVSTSIQPLRLFFTLDTLSVRSYLSPTNYKERSEECELFPVFPSLEGRFFFLNGKGIAEFIVPDEKEKTHFSQFILLSTVKGLHNLHLYLHLHLYIYALTYTYMSLKSGEKAKEQGTQGTICWRVSWG